MDFSSSPPPGPGGKMDSATRDQLMSQVKQQIALANAQELLQVRRMRVRRVLLLHHTFEKINLDRICAKN